MHELAIIENLFTIVQEQAKENGIVRIKEVDLVVGKMHHLVPDLMEFAFETIIENTLAEGSKLSIEWIEVEMECRDCQQRFKLNDFIFICPECGSVQLDQLGGKELYVKSIAGDTHGN